MKRDARKGRTLEELEAGPRWEEGAGSVLQPEHHSWSWHLLAVVCAVHCVNNLGMLYSLGPGFYCFRLTEVQMDAAVEAPAGAKARTFRKDHSCVTVHPRALGACSDSDAAVHLIFLVALGVPVSSPSSFVSAPDYPVSAAAGPWELWVQLQVSSIFLFPH